MRADRSVTFLKQTPEHHVLQRELFVTQHVIPESQLGYTELLQENTKFRNGLHM